MKRWTVVGLAMAAFALAVPAGAAASSVLRVTDGKARTVENRFLPPRSQTALPTLTRS